MSPTSAPRRSRPDYIFLVTVIGLVVAGLVMIYSISPVLSHKLIGAPGKNYFFINQAISIAVGLGALVFASRLPYTWWKRLSVGLLIASVVSSLALLVPGLGHAENGATRWLGFGALKFQPAELFKLALICYLASWLSAKSDQLNDLKKGLAPFLGVIALVSVPVVFFQRDLGTMMVIAASVLGILFVAGLSYKHLAIIVAVGMALLLIAIAAFPHRLSRLTTFLNPAQDASGNSYHINQALIAVGSGGVAGVGLGKSVQVYGYLPEAANDSIFAIIAEEFGIVGSLLVIGGFGLLAYRGYRIAVLAPDGFSRLLAAGLTTSLLFQAIINIAAMLSLVPLTGIPLPYISYGGSSMVISLLMAGMLFNISKYSIREGNYAHSGSGRWHGGTRFAGAGYHRSLTKT